MNLNFTDSSGLIYLLTQDERLFINVGLNLLKAALLTSLIRWERFVTAFWVLEFLRPAGIFYSSYLHVDCFTALQGHSHSLTQYCNVVLLLSTM